MTSYISDWLKHVVVSVLQGHVRPPFCLCRMSGKLHRSGFLGSASYP